MAHDDRVPDAAAPFRLGQFVGGRVSADRAEVLASRFDHVASRAGLTKEQLERRRARLRAERNGKEPEQGHVLDSAVDGLFDLVIEAAANLAGGLLDSI